MGRISSSVVRGLFCCALLADIGPAYRMSRRGKPTAAETMALLGKGINLGNTYDYPANDPSVGSVSRMIDIFVEKGFDHVRIPVTWGDSLFNDGSVQTERVKQVVKYALDKGLYVILNAHHEHWLKQHYDNSAHYNNRFAALWRDIASHFSGESPRLVFEILNEPDGTMGGWGPGHASPSDPHAIGLTRAINDVGYNAVRNVTKDRVILVMPNGMGSQSMASAVYPDPGYLPGGGSDQYLGVSVHTYDSSDFCGQDGRLDYFSSIRAMEDFYAGTYAPLAEWQRRTQIPMHVGEYGFGRSESSRQWERDTDMARAYYKHVTSFFAKNGWPSTVWDDEGWFAITRDYEFVNGLADAILSTGGSP